MAASIYLAHRGIKASSSASDAAKTSAKPAQALADPADRERLRHARPRIERLRGLIVHCYHPRKSRYLGARKATLQATWNCRARSPSVAAP